MKAGASVVINMPGHSLHGRPGVIVSMVGEYARVAVVKAEVVALTINTVALDPAPGVCPTCGAELPGDRRKGE